MERTKPNGVLEDICAEIGFTATCLLVGEYGGGNLYVPEKVREGHTLAQIVGVAAFKRLVDAYGSRDLWIPTGALESMGYRDRIIIKRFAKGASASDIAAEFGISMRRAQQLRRAARGKKMLPQIPKVEDCADLFAAEN